LAGAYELQNDRLREESIAPLLNKVSKFITNPLLRAVIGQTTSSFDFRWAMDTGKILLCNLSKGALGEDVISLLGSLIVPRLSLAALSRQDTPEADRWPHFLFADEVQNFTHGVDFPTILSEARKYALSLTIGTQTLSQLPGTTIEAVFGNCATIVSFRVSGEHAKALVREFAASGEGARIALQSEARSKTSDYGAGPIPFLVGLSSVLQQTPICSSPIRQNANELRESLQFIDEIEAVAPSWSFV
jgi:hypothetical protein